MNNLRKFLPIYKKLINYFANGKGYGKKKPVKRILSVIDSIFQSNFVEVRGQKMYLIEGFEEYSTEGVYGALDTEIVESLIKPNDFVVDIGAAIGYFTLIFGRLVGKDGLVIAFEPKEDRFVTLEKNVNINNFNNIKLENKAILNESGTSTFFSLSDGAGLHFAGDNDEFINKENDYEQKIPKKVSTVNLDKYLKELGILEKISFIKIDVDGPELIVLQSSELLLKNKNLKILIEWDLISSERSKCKPEVLVELLFENDFKVFYPNYKEKRYFQVSKNELLKLKPYNETINLLCVKDLSVIKNNNYFKV
jgi:FkbM family methyltransferase